jgi:hypothetical protein
MDARQLLRIELLTDLSGLSMADLERQRDCFSNHVIGRQQVIRKPEIPERAKDFNDACMMGVFL